MIKIEHTEIPYNCWEPTIRGMRNPMNSWGKSDTNYKVMKIHYLCDDTQSVGTPDIGEDDLKLMMRLAKGGSVHAKYRRMITVFVDITAPLYWWKEFDTYKVGTVANSCSTMHKIHSKPFVLDDFSHDKLLPGAKETLCHLIDQLNFWRSEFLDSNNKVYWEQMIQLLPTSYNQKRTILLNYEVLVGMFRDRKSHKLDEWHVLCDWIRELPYSEIITVSQ